MDWYKTTLVFCGLLCLTLSGCKKSVFDGAKAMAETEALGKISPRESGGGGAPAKPSRPSGGSSPSFPPGAMPPGGPPSGSSSSSSSDSTPPSGGGSQTASQQVRIWPDKVSNRLVISAPKSKLPEVMRLLDILDTDKPQDVTVRILALKNVSASDLAKELTPLYQKMGGRSPRETIEVTANERSNSLIIFSSEANFKVIEKLVTGLDTEDAMDKVTRTFPLKNADAQDAMQRMLQATPLRRVELRRTTLDEVFVRLVGGDESVLAAQEAAGD